MAVPDPVAVGFEVGCVTRRPGSSPRAKIMKIAKNMSAATQPVLSFAMARWVSEDVSLSKLAWLSLRRSSVGSAT